jgi:hypothetical protein
MDLTPCNAILQFNPHHPPTMLRENTIDYRASHIVFYQYNMAAENQTIQSLHIPNDKAERQFVQRGNFKGAAVSV